MPTYPNNKSTIVEYDILRVIVTLFVIIGHCTYYQISTQYGGCDYSAYTEPGLSMFYKLINALTAAIYLFHMPLYMALSGALFNYQNMVNGGVKPFGKLIKNKFFKLMIPFFVVTILYQIPLKYLSGYYDTSSNVLRDCFLGQILVQGNTHLWFLPDLFIIFIIVYIIVKYVHIDHKLILLGMFIISFVISNIAIPISVIKVSLHYLFWFYVGYCFEMHRNSVNKSLEKHPVSFILFFIIFLCAGILKKIVSNMADVSEMYSVLEKFDGYICAVTGCYIVYSVSYYLSKTKITEWPLFKAIRSNSLGLYLYSDTWNYVILNVAVGLFGSAVFVTNIGAAMLYFSRIIITFTIALIISIILKKCKVKYIC